MRRLLGSAVKSWSNGLMFFWLVQAGASVAHAADVDAQSADVLLAKYETLKNQLRHNPFQKPIVLESNENPARVAGDMYALINYPYSTVRAALVVPEHWCDVFILHFNTKYCRAAPTDHGVVLNVSVGKKYDQPLDDAYRVDFVFRVADQTSNYLRVKLKANKGPIGTQNYRIVLEAVPLAKAQTFIHFSYSYGYGLAGRLAMSAYLGTIGSDKVGFSVVNEKPDGQPAYVGGMRGVVERNTMRYYLAIESFLGALSAPPQAQLEKRLRDWFAFSELYPLQLHEMDRQTYLDMKHREYSRQQGETPAPRAAQNE